MNAINAYDSQYYTTEEIGYLEFASHMQSNARKVASGEMPAFNVILTPESVELGVTHNAEAFAQKLEGSASDGTSITVQRSGGIYSSTPDIKNGYINADTLMGYTYSANLSDANGNDFVIDFTDNIKATKNAAGNLSVYLAESNTTRTYAADGSYLDEEGDLTDQDADTIYVITNDKAVSIGNGNNTVFVYGNNSSIKSGSGNDSFYLAGQLSNVKIDTGAGDDKISSTTSFGYTSGKTVYGLNLTLNDGNNTVDIAHMVGGSIIGGDGDNTLKVDHAQGVEVSLDNGNNFYKGTLDSGANLRLGNGNNTLDIHSVGQVASYSYNASSASVSLGNGDNNVRINQVQENSSVSLGNGSNNLNIYEVESSSALIIGNGDNKVSIYQVEENSNFSLGSGNNKVNMYSLEGKSGFAVGDGDNALSIYGVKQDSSLTVGRGSNDVKVDTLDNAAFQIGNGYNSLLVSNLIGNFSLSINGEAMDAKQAQALFDSLKGIKYERQKEDKNSIMEDDPFFDSFFDFSSDSRMPTDTASRDAIKASVMYARAAVSESVPLQVSMLPSRISQYINDDDLFKDMNYRWFNPQ
jgi:hypothetical protein